MASQTSGIAWRVTSKPDWVTSVTPSQGTGSQSIQISVTPATSSTQELSGSIVITSDNGQSTSISVTRCVKCSPSTGAPQYSNAGTVDADACDTSKTVQVPYTVEITDAQCNKTTSSSTSSVTETFSQNCTSSVKTHTFRYFTVRQAAGPCDDCYTDCDCEPDYGTGTGTAPATGGNVTVTWNYTYPNCSNPRCSNGSVTASIEVGCNSGEERTIRDSHPQYGNYVITQAAGTPEGCGQCTYTCNDHISFEAYDMPIAAAGGSRVPVAKWTWRPKSKGDAQVGIGVAINPNPGRDNPILNVHSKNDWTYSDPITDGDYMYRIIYAPIYENTSTDSRTTHISVTGYVCSDRVYTGDDTIPTSVTTCSMSDVTITQEGKAVSYCECYKDIVVSPVTVSSYSDTSATITWTYTHRKTDGTTEMGSSSTTVTFEANDTTSTVTRTGSKTWTNHKLCDGNDCGDNAVINWEVSVPGKPAEPDFSTKIDVGVHSDYGTRMCRYDTNIDTNYISVNRGGLDIDIAGNFSGDAYIKFYPDADSRTQLAREEDRMKYIIWQTGDTISRIEGNSWDEVDSSKFETFGELTYGGPISTIILNSGGRIVVEFWIQQHC